MTEKETSKYDAETVREIGTVVFLMLFPIYLVYFGLLLGAAVRVFLAFSGLG